MTRPTNKKYRTSDSSRDSGCARAPRAASRPRRLPAAGAQERPVFDAEAGVWTWDCDDRRLDFDVGEDVRFRVQSIAFRPVPTRADMQARRCSAARLRFLQLCVSDPRQSVFPARWLHLLFLVFLFICRVCRLDLAVSARPLMGCRHQICYANCRDRRRGRGRGASCNRHGKLMALRRPASSAEGWRRGTAQREAEDGGAAVGTAARPYAPMHVSAHHAAQSADDRPANC